MVVLWGRFLMTEVLMYACSFELSNHAKGFGGAIAVEAIEALRGIREEEVEVRA